MEVIIFEKETHLKMREEMLQEIRKAVKEECEKLYKKELTNDWISLGEAKQLLCVKSKSRMQEMRDNGEITFTQYGRIIQYSRKSIMEFLDRHKVKAWNR